MGKRIKLAILDNDQNYLQRIISVFSVKYADKLEMYSFTDKKVALASIKMNQPDVFIVSSKFEIEEPLIPKKCTFAYLVDTPGVDSVGNYGAIFKFQKADQLYKQILNLYSEHAGYISAGVGGDGSTRTIAFISPAGGAGGSSMAAACALHFAQRGEKTLYINLEKLGSADRFFSSDGSFSMSDVIFALKSKKSGLSLKLESCVKQDRSGVFFYSQTRSALDMTELSFDEMRELLNVLKQGSTYQTIIADIDFSIERPYLDFCSSFDEIVMVSDGSELCNSKIRRAYEAIAVLEQNAGIKLLGKTALVYNKFSNKTGKLLDDLDLRTAGGAPRVENADTHRIIEQISALDIFDKL